MTIRVVIADDHPIVRAGIRAELSAAQGFEILAEALDGDAALRLARELRPDVLLLDVNMPGFKAVKVLKALKAAPESCRVLVLTAYRDPGTVQGMLRAGADGYILKDENPALISEAVRATAAGRRWISPALQELANKAALPGAPRQPGDALTGREQEVLMWLASGAANRQIAAELQTTERTIEFHVSNILTKLGVTSRLEAALWAREHGLVG